MKKKIDDNILFDAAELFKVFGDSTRIRILNCLNNSERSVNEISQLLNMNQSAISHQLKILRNYKLIENRRDGKTIYYSLDDSRISNIINQGIEHVTE